MDFTGDSRTEAALADAANRISELTRDVQDLKRLLQGAEQKEIQVPSGIPGFNNLLMIPAVTMGNVLTEDISPPLQIIPQDTGFILGKGSIIDGTNGNVLFSTDGEKVYPGTSGFIIIEAQIGADLKPTSWAVRIASETEAAVECLIQGTDPAFQKSARLLIGKISPTDGVSQAWFSSARLIGGVMNGIEVRVFEAAPTHPTIL